MSEKNKTKPAPKGLAGILHNDGLVGLQKALDHTQEYGPWEEISKGIVEFACEENYDVLNLLRAARIGTTLKSKAKGTPFSTVGFSILRGIEHYLNLQGILAKTLVPDNINWRDEKQQEQKKREIEELLQLADALNLHPDAANLKGSLRHLFKICGLVPEYVKADYRTIIYLDMYERKFKEKSEIDEQIRDYDDRLHTQEYSNEDDAKKHHQSYLFPQNTLAFVKKLSAYELPFARDYYHAHYGGVSLKDLEEETNQERFNHNVLRYIAAMPRGNWLRQRIIEGLFMITPLKVQDLATFPASEDTFSRKTLNFQLFLSGKINTQLLGEEPEDNGFFALLNGAIGNMDVYNVAALELMYLSVSKNEPGLLLYLSGGDEMVLDQSAMLRRIYGDTSIVNKSVLTSFYNYRFFTFLFNNIDIIKERLGARLWQSDRHRLFLHCLDLNAVEAKKNILNIRGEFVRSVKEQHGKAEEDSKFLKESDAFIVLMREWCSKLPRYYPEKREDRTPLMTFKADPSHASWGIDEVAFHFGAADTPIGFIVHTLPSDAAVVGSINPDFSIEMGLDPATDKQVMDIVHYLVLFTYLKYLESMGIPINEASGLSPHLLYEKTSLLTQLRLLLAQTGGRITYGKIAELVGDDAVQQVRVFGGIQAVMREVKEEKPSTEKLGEEDANKAFLDLMSGRSNEQ